MYNLFSSLLTPLKRFRLAFSLLCVKKTFFLFLLSVACGFLLLVCGEARRFTCFEKGLQASLSSSLLSSPLEAPLRRPPFSRGLEKGLEAPFEN